MNLVRLLGALFDWRSRRVCARNAAIYLRNWHTGLVPPVLEPLLYLFAFGFGLGGYVGVITWRGIDLPYANFVAPGIAAQVAFSAPYFQGLYGAYVRMRYQRTWDAQLTTQIELEHVVSGEILWAGLLAAMYTSMVCIALGVAHAIGLVSLHWWCLPYIPLMAAFAGFAFAALALIFTALVPTIDHMNLPVFLFAWPLSFLSDTYFPTRIENPIGRALMMGNPVHHLAEGFRALLMGADPTRDVIGVVVTCSLLLAICFPLATRLTRRRVLGGG